MTARRQHATRHHAPRCRYARYTRHHRLETIVTVMFLAVALVQHIWIHTFK